MSLFTWIFGEEALYPYSKQEYINRMLDRSRRLRECEEKLMWLQARYNYLKATGKELLETNFNPILSCTELQVGAPQPQSDQQKSE